MRRHKEALGERGFTETLKHTTPVYLHPPVHPHTHTLTFDGADNLVQVFGVVAVRSTARADLQRVVGSVLCEELVTKQAQRQFIFLRRGMRIYGGFFHSSHLHTVARRTLSLRLVCLFFFF